MMLNKQLMSQQSLMRENEYMRSKLNQRELHKIDRAADTLHHKTVDVLRYKDWLTHYPAPVHPAYLQPRTTIIEAGHNCMTPCHSSHKLLNHCCTGRSCRGCSECARDQTVYMLPPVATS